MKKLVPLGASIALTLFLLPALNAQLTLSINLVAEGQTALTSSDSAGLFAATNWNNFQNLTDAEAGSSGTRERVYAFDATTDRAGTGVLVGSNNGVSFDTTGTALTMQQRRPANRFLDGVTGSDSNALMMRTGRGDNHGSGGDMILTMTGIGSEFTVPGYDLYVYLGNRNANNTTDNSLFELFLDGASTASQALTVTIAAANTFPDPGFVQSTDTVAGNYIVFQGLTATDFVLDLSGGGNQRSYGIAGIQIVGVMPIPEPSTYALVLGGLVVFAFVAVRRRRS